MNTKFLLAIATAIGVAASATIAAAAPLPAFTLLTVEKAIDTPDVGPAPGCTNGSCFGLYLFAGLYAWTPLGPGTDGGIIVGKAQRCWSNWVGPTDGFVCEMTEGWNYGD